MGLPQIGISYLSSIPESIVDEFRVTISHPKLDLRSESREHDIYAGVEWFLPTALVVYISKSYFDGFLKEMGKDHYLLLKNALIKIKSKLQEYKLTASKGKISKESIYTFSFSIYAEADNDQRFKLLIQKDIAETEYEEIIEAFLNFLSSYNNKTLAKTELDKLSIGDASSKTLLIAYNFKKHDLEAVEVSRGSNSKEKT
jgi:hypothetical protein